MTLLDLNTDPIIQNKHFTVAAGQCGVSFQTVGNAFFSPSGSKPMDWAPPKGSPDKSDGSRGD